MANDKTQFDSLNQQTQLIDRALKYTDGNLEKARLMVAGQNNDVKVIKGRFAIEESLVYGIFIIFINIMNKYVMNVNTLLVTNKVVFSKARVFDNWRTFYLDFGKYIKKEGENAMGSYDFTNHVLSSLTGYDIITEVEKENLESVTRDLKDIIGKFFSVSALQCQIEIEETNSLALELEDIPVEILGKDDSIGESGESADSGEVSQLKKIEEEAEYIVNGKIIVSPVKGKYINDISVGESIKVLLVNKDPISMGVARTLNALSSEGEYLPVKVRVKAMLPIETGGFTIYCVIAKNVLVKIIEEENVKIEVDMDKSSSLEKDEGKLIIYLALLFGLVLITLLIIFSIL